MWLRHFLSKDLPNCPVMTYGYNSNIGQGLETIRDYERGLQEQIKLVRRTKEASR